MDVRRIVTHAFLPLIQEPGRIYNLKGSAAAMLLSLLQAPFVAVENDEAKAKTLIKDILFYRRIFSGCPVLFLPDPDGAAAAGDRAEVISRMDDAVSIVTSARNLHELFRNRQALDDAMITISTSIPLSRDILTEALARLGYRNVSMVLERGEFSNRGWIIDIFPSSMHDPLRIEYFGDDIESIMFFDVETQRSTGPADNIRLMPAAEPDEGDTLSDLTGQRQFFFLYQPEEPDDVPEHALILSKYPFEGEQDDKETRHCDAGMIAFNGLGLLPDERQNISAIAAPLRALSQSRRTMLIASSEGQAKRLQDVLRDEDMIIPLVPAEDIQGFGGQVSLSTGSLSSGIYMNGLVILTERELFGERPAYRPSRTSRVSKLLTSLDDIMPGDHVVHRDHGIGRFSGITRQHIEGASHELLMIDYEDGRLYMPIQDIHIISKYRSEEGKSPVIDRLGGKTWARKKNRARKKINELAARLLSLYATRKAARGFRFSSDTELHREFDSFFAYEETPDQAKAIEAIRQDMESDRPMERLVCGDVGYGKTEVAMRAAFRAVYDQRQVALLVPTTILADQHYRTFAERFSGFPVNIDFISRFKSRTEIRKSLNDLSAGKTDIIIGTQALLAKNVSFSNLGLLIIDEEHRFGVAQKERLKELCAGVDILSLTATPIPRTLHMTLSGIRDISVIETAPEERLAVKSVVTVLNDRTIQSAMTSELHRGGQVFFVHNRIRDIDRVAGHVRRLVPGASLAVAHGQMSERQLETIMHDFVSGKLDVLVSTAIIGSGLDITRANTIIINRADTMGLADLYQLRGRVGRSSLKGYAYFIAPPENMLTEEAKKRLQYIQEMSYLGAGFRLAMKDLEIRGAGDIFGADQSGHMHEIGFDLYIEMLEQAVAELRGIEIQQECDPVIELKTSAFIPEDYVSDMTLRLSFYRRIAGFRTDANIQGFIEELKDRFGPLPAEVLHLLDIMKLKIIARPLYITKIQQVHNKIRVLFSEQTPVEPRTIFLLPETWGSRIRFVPEGFEFEMGGDDAQTTYRNIYQLIASLQNASGEQKTRQE